MYSVSVNFSIFPFPNIRIRLLRPIRRSPNATSVFLIILPLPIKVLSIKPYKLSLTLSLIIFKLAPKYSIIPSLESLFFIILTKLSLEMTMFCQKHTTSMPNPFPLFDFAHSNIQCSLPPNNYQIIISNRKLKTLIKTAIGVDELKNLLSSWYF